MGEARSVFRRIFKNGTYGVCGSVGNKTHDMRFKAIPSASFDEFFQSRSYIAEYFDIKSRR
jgi:hypothetical protein